MGRKKGTTTAAAKKPQTKNPQTVREVERKLKVHALFRLPDLNGAIAPVAVVDPQPTRTMTAVYHDTDDLRLFRWGVTLRRREGGPDEGWHMKLPVTGEGEGVRDEIRLPLDAGPVGEVPAALTSIVTALAREEPLVPVATLRTERTPHLLLDSEHTPQVELVDDTVSILDGDHVAARFRELEAEALTEDGIEVLDDVVLFLTDHGAVPGGTSKAAHALGPRASASPDVVEREAPGPDGPAGDAVRAHLAKHVRRFLLQDVRVRRDLPDSVHQMRVAARRLRSGLKVFGPLVDEAWSDHLRGELGWIAGELGRVRDTEVMLANLLRHSCDLPDEQAAAATDALERILSAELATARQQALLAMQSPRHLALLIDLVDAVHRPRLTPEAERPCREVLVPLMDRSWRRLRKRVRKLDVATPAHPWHLARIDAKKARYSAELLTPVFGDPARTIASALEDVTELLGDHQDCHVAQTELVSLSRRGDVTGAEGFAFGLLHVAEEAREHQLRERFAGVWQHTEDTYRTCELTR